MSIPVESHKKVYGKPASFSPNNRARFNKKLGSINIEIVIVNQASEGWKRNITFENYLKAHPETLDEYRKLKEESNGIGLRQYYRKKMEFINDILKKASK